LREAGAPRGMHAFTALAVLLARATPFDEVERHGAGARSAALTVPRLVGKLNNDLDAGAPPLEVHAA
jgi:hypothetical protein